MVNLHDRLRFLYQEDRLQKDWTRRRMIEQKLARELSIGHILQFTEREVVRKLQIQNAARMKQRGSLFLPKDILE